MWKILTHAKTEQSFENVWSWIIQEFSDQEELLQYLQTNWLGIQHQWADCHIRTRLNYGGFEFQYKELPCERQMRLG